MPLFQYKGRNQRGEAVRGHLEAISSDAVAAQLMNSGVIPIDIGVARVREDIFTALRARLAASTRITLTDLSLFSRQMYTLLKAGVPIMQALRGLRESTQNPALAKVIASISESLDTGLDLTSALRRHPQVFSSRYVLSAKKTPAIASSRRRVTLSSSWPRFSSRSLSSICS